VHLVELGSAAGGKLDAARRDSSKDAVMQGSMVTARIAMPPLSER